MYPDQSVEMVYDSAGQYYMAEFEISDFTQLYLEAKLSLSIEHVHSIGVISNYFREYNSNSFPDTGKPERVEITDLSYDFTVRPLLSASPYNDNAKMIVYCKLKAEYTGEVTIKAEI